MGDYVVIKMIQDRIRANRTKKPKASANWFRDPRGEAPYRYWDGERWTEDTATSLP